MLATLSGRVVVVEPDVPEPSDVLMIAEVSMISLEVVDVGNSSSVVVPTLSVMDAVSIVVLVLVVVLVFGSGSSPPAAQWPSDVQVSPKSQYPPFEQHTPLIGIQLISSQ